MWYHDNLGCKINIAAVKTTQSAGKSILPAISESPGFSVISWQLHAITSFPEESTGSSNQSADGLFSTSYLWPENRMLFSLVASMNHPLHCCLSD